MGVITLMGSGETSPTMVKVHRRLLDRTDDPRAVFVDTPFGFQANADDITEKVTEYFATSLNTELEIASLRSADRATAGERERMLEASPRGGLSRSPGREVPATPCGTGRRSDSAMWSSTVLAQGGAVTLASAAAVTAGAVSLPGLRDLQGGRRSELDARLGRSVCLRSEGGRDSAFRQRRRRHARHPVLLHGPDPVRLSDGGSSMTTR